MCAPRLLWLTSNVNRKPSLDGAGASKKRKILVSDAKKQIQSRGNDLIKFINNEMKTRP